MARRYTRDNRGRFASVGATARGGRLRTAAGNKRDTQTKAISGAKPGGTVGKPKGLKPGSIKPKASQAYAAKPAPKVDTSVAALARRRSRANAERTSLVSQKVNMKSAVVRSAANAIYNRQRVVSKGSTSVHPSVLRDGIGVLRGISGSRRDRAMQNLEAATKRVRSGRRR